METRTPLLEITDLHVEIRTDTQKIQAVNGSTMQVFEGQTVGIVGESGCGKTMTTYSILNILPKVARITKGSLLFRKSCGNVVDLATLPSDGNEIRSIRGKEIAMIFQEPMSAFSPVHTIGNQIMEAILTHHAVTKKQARARALDLLGMVGIPDPKDRLDDYSFQFSGGMRQRAMIAMALACTPRLVLADEPTSALDVTIQAQVLGLLKKMQQELKLSLVLITHDLGVIAHMVDYLYVMYLGRVVEEGTVKDVYKNPKHPYTKDLLHSIPKLTGVKGRLATIEGSVPDYLPAGCAFHPRCTEKVGDICEKQRPPTLSFNESHACACFKYSLGMGG